MARVVFTSNLQRHVACPPVRAAGTTVRAVLEGAFADNPRARGYVLDALDVDSTGDRLVFGSTTGGLWISEDQGDAWQLVSAHLPPVYAVCFAR